MSRSYSTRWSVIEGAAQGDEAAKAEFVRRYEDAVHAYLGARWRDTDLLQDLPDAAQEVFLDCLRPDGVLSRVESGRPGGFRAYFFGVILKIALRFERRAARQRLRQAEDSRAMEGVAADDEELGAVFDRSWAQAILREAAAFQAEQARDDGASRRVELLRLRFADDLPIREIARRWNVEPASLHHEYAKAREEFQGALREVVAFHHPGTPGEVKRECARLLDLVP